MRSRNALTVSALLVLCSGCSGSAAPPPTPPAGAVRRHVVQKGDTLFVLAQKYYSNRSRWREIYEANRDIMPNENSLQIGMELKIP